MVSNKQPILFRKMLVWQQNEGLRNRHNLHNNNILLVNEHCIMAGTVLKIDKRLDFSLSSNFKMIGNFINDKKLFLIEGKLYLKKINNYFLQTTSIFNSLFICNLFFCHNYIKFLFLFQDLDIF